MDLDMDAGSSASLAVLDGLRADQDSDTEQVRRRLVVGARQGLMVGRP